MHLSIPHRRRSLASCAIPVVLCFAGCSQDPPAPQPMAEPDAAESTDAAAEVASTPAADETAVTDPNDDQSSAPPEQMPEDTAATDEVATADADADRPLEVTLQTGTWDDVQAQIADSDGKVVVVDVWSTSCLPCIKELPQLGQLQRDHEEDVVCISLSVDYLGIKSKPPEYYEERVLQVLEKCEADVINYLCTTDVDTVFDELELDSIPAVYVYGKDGQLAQRFDSSMASEDSADEEPFTYEADIVPLVKQLIGASD